MFFINSKNRIRHKRFQFIAVKNYEIEREKKYKSTRLARRLWGGVKFKFCLCQEQKSRENPRGIMCQFVTVFACQ